MSWNTHILQQLEARKNSDLHRKRLVLDSAQGREVVVAGQKLLNFSSNDYLGLANSAHKPRVTATSNLGLGSGASHLVCGHSQAHQALEEALAESVGYPRALLFANGYMVNLALLQALVGRGDLLLQDKLNHASLIDGGLLSNAHFHRYRHLDYSHLEQQLFRLRPDQQAKTGLIASDAVFSMDGDQADLNTLSALSQKHDMGLMIDDAHGFGTFITRDNGQILTGSTAHQGVSHEQVPVYMGTLGKALGGYGAFVAASEDIIEYLIQFARPYIYTTALPPAFADSMLVNLEEVMTGKRQTQLADLIIYFKKKAAASGIELMPSDTAIQPILIGDDAKALAISDTLKAHGVLVTAIRPPTVPKGTARLRITLTASHTECDVDHLLANLSRIQETEHAA